MSTEDQQAETASTGQEQGQKTSEPTLADVMARIDKLEADSTGRNRKLVEDMASLRKKVQGSEGGSGEKQETGAPKGLNQAQVAELVEYRVTVASLPDEHRKQVETLAETAGPGAGLALARALAETAKDSKQTTTTTTTARAGTAASPPAGTTYSPLEIMKLPPEERTQVLAQIRKGEGSFARGN